MMEHNASTGHPICVSFDDSSFWCYGCDSYVDHFCEVSISHVLMSQS